MHQRKRRTAALAAFLLIPLITTVTTIIAAGPAMAADHSARRLSAVADKFGSQYILWRSSRGQLEQGFYNAFTKSWKGPFNLGLGPLGSEPTVAASPTQIIETQGGSQHFSWTYAYWQGPGPRHNLMFAYYGGKGWKGPFNLGMGSVGAPSASDNLFMGRQQMEIYWKGADGRLWYTSSGGSPWLKSDYTKPAQASFKGRSFGQIGSPPSASADASDCTKGICAYVDTVVWQGANGELWGAGYSMLNRAWTSGPRQFEVGPHLRPYRNKLGSAPAVVMETTIGQPDMVWQGTGSSRSLFIIPNGAHLVADLGMGPLGSVPEVVWSPATDKLAVDDQLFVFWTDFSGSLWEGHFDSSSGWHHFKLKQLGKIA